MCIYIHVLTFVVYSSILPTLLIVDTHFHDTFSTSSIQPNPTSLWAQFMYYIIFFSFKHDPSLCNLWEKLRKCDWESMGRFLLDLLHEHSPCVLLSGQGTLVIPLAQEGGLVPEIFTQNSFFALVDCDLKFLP